MSLCRSYKSLENWLIVALFQQLASADAVCNPRTENNVEMSRLTTTGVTQLRYTWQVTTNTTPHLHQPTCHALLEMTKEQFHLHKWGS